MEQKIQVRKSGVEILRLIGIFMVVSIHATGLIEGIALNRVGSTVTRMINIFGNLGVSAFILISGYFGVKRDWKKMLKLEIKVIFYSVCTTVLMRLVWPMDHSRSVILPLLERSVMPVVTRKHWYYSCYMCLLLFSPYINLVIEKISQKEFKELLISSFIIFSIVPTFLRYDIMNDGGKGLVNMIMLYLAGRYVRMYRDFRINKVTGLCILGALCIAVYGLTFVPVRTNLFALDILNDNSITLIAICIVMLYIAKDLSFQSEKINRAAKHVFGIYILNVPVMKVLNHFLFRLDEAKISGNYMPLWIGALIFTTILICFGIDVLYDKLTEKIIIFKRKIK